MILSGHQSNYLPYPGLFAKIFNSDCFIYVNKVKFENKSWQSRNRIIGDKSYIMLTVPTLKKNSSELIKDIQINNTANWKHKHFKSIEINYKKSVFYKKYIKFFEDLYSKDWNKICDLNVHITNFIIKELEIETKIFYDTDYDFKKKKTERLIEMCQTINADTYLSNLGSQDYVDLNFFKKKKINHFFMDFKTETYKQKKNSFIPNLTIFDMLFFCGKEKTKKIIKNKANIVLSKNFHKLV
jgi:hypothetical protein